MDFDPFLSEERLAAAGYMARMEDARLTGHSVPTQPVERSHYFWNTWADQERRRAELEENQ